MNLILPRLLLTVLFKKPLMQRPILLNSDKAKGVARCKELIALREGEDMVPYLVEESAVGFGIVAVELK